jgi:Uma2 family endonuclease
MAGRARTSMVDDFEKVSPATILPMRFMGTELPNAARKRRRRTMNEPTPALLTYDDFRQFVADKDGRYEFVDGHAVALASPSKPHARLALALGTKLQAHLAPRRCDVYMDTDVWTGHNARRPDLSITCDEHDIENDDDVLRAPTVLIEILSDNLGDDLKEKLDEYQSMPSVEEYVVMDSRKRWVRHYYRSAEGRLIFDHDYIAGNFRLASIGFIVEIEALYTEARIR